MPATPRLALSSGLLLLICAGSAAGQSWPAAGLALRTNGSSFRDGECVRLSLLALEDVGGPFVPQVTYGFKGAPAVPGPAVPREVLERLIERGITPVMPVGAAVRTFERPVGTVLERLDTGTAAVLDDTFCFGVGSVPGPYEITVSLTSGNVKTGTLTTCVEFQPESAGSPAPSAVRCGFGLRGVSRRSDANVLTLEGQWPYDGSGLFRLVFLRGDRVLYLLEGGLVAEGPGELTFIVPNLGPEGAGQVDLLLQDQWGGKATTLAGVSLQR